MLILWLTGGSAYSLLTLPVWERERLADALVLLTTDPRPPFAGNLAHLTGDALEIWVGSERRIRYRVYKDDEGDDVAVVVFEIV